MMKYDKLGIVAGLSLFVIMLTTATNVSAIKATPYEAGYNHGINDCNGGNYLNTPGRGPSFHTSEFMNGYYRGLHSCNAVSSPNNSVTQAQGNVQSNPRCLQFCANDNNQALANAR